MAEKNRGFDVLGKGYDAKTDYVSALVNCFNQINSRPPEDHPGIAEAAGRFICKRQGDRLMLEYHLMDHNLSDSRRVEDLYHDANKSIGALATELKKEFKKFTKKALKLKEDKDSAGWHREQVSLNGMWYLRVWRIYDVSPEADQSDEA